MLGMVLQAYFLKINNKNGIYLLLWHTKQKVPICIALDIRTGVNNLAITPQNMVYIHLSIHDMEKVIRKRRSSSSSVDAPNIQDITVDEQCEAVHDIHIEDERGGGSESNIPKSMYEPHSVTTPCGTVLSVLKPVYHASPCQYEHMLSQSQTSHAKCMDCVKSKIATAANFMIN